MHITRYEPNQNPQGLSPECEYYDQSQRIDIVYALQCLFVFLCFGVVCIVLFGVYSIGIDAYHHYATDFHKLFFRLAVLAVVLPIVLIVTYAVHHTIESVKEHHEILENDDLESGYSPLDLQDAEQKTMYRIPRTVEKFSTEWEECVVDIYDAMKKNGDYKSKSAFLIAVTGYKTEYYENQIRPILEKYGRQL